MLRVLFVNQYYWPDLSATAQHLADLAEGLAARGIGVDVLCSRGAYEQTGHELATRETHEGVNIRRLAPFGKRTKGLTSRLSGYGGFHAQAAAWIARHGSEYDAIITLTDPPLIGAHALLARKSVTQRVRQVIWCMDLYSDVLFALGSVDEKSALGIVLEQANRLELKQADVVVALGPCMADVLVRKGIPRERIEIIGAWNRADQLSPTPLATNALRQKHGLTDKFVVMYSGNAGQAHSFESIRYAMGALRDDPRVVFLFVGGGKRIAEIDDFVEREGLQNVMKLPYFPREQLNESLAMANVHLVSLRPRMAGVVVPSKLYGALAVGRPVLYVGPAESTVAREIRDADAGITLDVDDAEGFVTAIRTLADSPAECERMGANGHAFFLRTHEREVCCDAWYRLLLRVMG